MKSIIVALDARCIGNRKTGDTTYWTGLVHGLAQLDSNLRFLLFSNDIRPQEIPDNERLRWIRLPQGNSRLWSLVRFPLAARKLGASVVHTQYNLSPLVKAGVTTIHDVSFYVGPEWFKPKDRLLLGRFIPSSARRARRVITVSETSRQDIGRFLPDVLPKVAVTPLATNLGIRAVDRGVALETVSKELGVRAPYLLTVGTRWPRKNMRLAVDAASLLPENLEHKLVITGHSGWGDQELGKRGVGVGYVDESSLSCLYSGAEMYLAPSRYEGFGLPLLEAFTCSCPVLCSSGGSLPEVAGDAAEVEPTWEAEHWAASIAALLSDSSKLAGMRQRGVERAKRFSWKETARLTEQVYREAAG